MPSGFTEFLFPATPEGRFVNTLILLVFGWGLLRARAIGVAIGRERQTLKGVEEGLARFQSGAGADGAGEDAAQETVQTWDALRTRANLAVVDPATPPASLVGKRIHALWRLRNAGRGSMEAVSAIEEARQALSLDMPRYLTSILVLMGLAGTIAGLRGIIGQLNGALAGAASDPAALLQALEPMRSAFSCSLLGIATSILLALALTRVERAQGELMASLEETVTLDLMPLIFPASEEAQLHEMTGVLERSQKFLTDFGRTLGESREFFAETLGTAVRSAAQELQDRLSEATAALQKSLDEMRGTAATLSESTQNVVQYRAELEAERQQLESYLRESARQLADLSQAVLDPLQNAASGLVANRLAVEAVVLRNEDDRETLRQETAAIVGSIDILTGAMAEEKRAITGMAEQAHGILTASSTEFSQQIAHHAAQAKASAEILDTLMRQIHPEMLTLPNGKILGRSLSDVSQQLENVDSTLQHMAERLEARLSDAGTQTQDTNGQIQALIGAIQALTASNEKQQAASQTAALATLQEMRLLRSHLERPAWRTWIGQTNGNGQSR